MDKIKGFVKKNWLEVVAAIAIVVIIVCVLHWADKMDAKRPHYGKDNPKETQYGELTFADQTNNGERLPLCIELTAEGRGQFAEKTEYRIRFEYPDGLKAELENGHSNYEIDIQYSFQVEAGSYGYLRVMIYSQETQKMYRGESSFEALDDLCLKHDIAATPNLGEKMVDEPIKFVGPSYLEFTLFTSATPDDGPKTSSNARGIAQNWQIAGVARIT